MRKNKGITLIALVITVIVLLILAGVSIATLTGPNGILTQATEAKKVTEKAEVKEKVELEVVGSYDNNGRFQMEKLKENLKNNLGVTEEIEEDEEGSITFALDGNKVTVDKNGKVEVGEKVPVIEATSIKVEDLTIEVGTKTAKLNVTTTPSEITEGLIYTSKNSEVITVGNDGTVIVKGEGKAEVEVKGKKSGVKGECTVTVEFGVGVRVTGENKKYTDGESHTAVIPVGFAIVPGLDNISGGLVISDKLYDTDDAGNQFVWIPVNGNYEATTTYQNTLISSSRKNDTGYLPTDVEIGEPTQEKTLEDLTYEKEKKMVTEDMVKKYGVGGFYVSRYEAGKENADTLVSKKDANVWVSIKQETAKEKAKSFKLVDNTKVKSALISGVQWDMVMAFVNGKNDGGDPSQKFNVTTPLNSRHKGSDVGVEQSGKNLADKVCNIYDLEGNCGEYVAEKNTYADSRYPYDVRGGYYNDSNPASIRSDYSGIANGDLSFRFVLYVM